MYAHMVYKRYIYIYIGVRQGCTGSGSGTGTGPFGTGQFIFFGTGTGKLEPEPENRIKNRFKAPFSDIFILFFGTRIFYLHFLWSYPFLRSFVKNRILIIDTHNYDPDWWDNLESTSKWPWEKYLCRI